ncbi:hypothetical protein MMU07_06685 [Aquiflexum sp. LQ15W]|uniref:hypothetical protein n=1 Tax=Cognataquiflexum nitidum TaxID=2922272 RepID=UPI001F12BDF2|nr:hypothetical protein [Cognataquiflexum nitidum]MCH6199254.1 hypothetical protein [Cognataquiflexum nitidum]
MKQLLILILSIVLLGSCSVFGPNPEYYQGMTEKKFLRQNEAAVISHLDGNQKTYRVIRDEKFYVLATFEDGNLIKLEEREYTPVIIEDKIGNN